MTKLTWNLRRLMAEQGMFQTTDLGRRLAEHGVSLSREQVYRLVTATPQRMNMEVLAALCEILSCTPNDLISFEAIEARKVVGSDASAGSRAAHNLKPVPARIARPQD